MTTEETTILGNQSKVTIALLIGLIGLTAAGTWKAFESEYRLRALEQSMRQNWTELDMRIWANQLSNKNPELIVPDPEHYNTPNFFANPITK